MKVVGLILLSFIAAWLLAIWIHWNKPIPEQAAKHILPAWIIFSFLSVGIYLVFFK